MLLTLSQATTADIPGIQTLAKIVFQQAMAATHDAAYIERFLQRVYSENSLKRAFVNDGTIFLVAHADEGIVGMLQFGSPLFDDCEERKEIHKLYIHPDHIRHDIGGHLLADMITRLQATNLVREVFAYVPAGETARQNFYAKHGFEHIAAQDKQDEQYWLKLLYPAE